MEGCPYHIKFVEGLPLFHSTRYVFGCLHCSLQLTGPDLHSNNTRFTTLHDVTEDSTYKACALALHFISAVGWPVLTS